MVRFQCLTLKKSYNKNVKNTQLGKAIRETAEKGLGDIYDKGTEMIGNTRHLNGVADFKKGNVSKLVGMSGLGLRPQGEGVMKDADSTSWISCFATTR